MAEPKDAYLDQSYYGPAIPPERAVEGRAGRPKPTSIFKDCSPYSLVCHAFKILTIILIVIGSVVLVLWLIYQPTALKVYVESASLSHFNLTPSTGSLSFNLSSVLTVRNPNKRVGVFYKHVQASAFYGDAHLGDLVLPLFHQPKKNTTTFDLAYAGSLPAVGGPVNETYARERGEGWFYLTLRFYTKVRLRVIVVNSVEYTPEADCSLRIPAPGNATSAREGFQRTDCRVDQFS